jgi:MFS transporter, MHS family, citrate/tricarballylate:H+ symporter
VQSTIRSRRWPASTNGKYALPALGRRHIAAVTLGNAVEFYDFLVYVFFSIQIGHALFPPASAYTSLMFSLATFAAGFIMRPVGAVVIGAYADRVGRKPAMLLCFILIGISILAMALIPPYSAIGPAAPVLAVIARMAQGFSLGGEMGSNTAFLIEAAAPMRRGLIASWQGASQLLAALFGSLLGVALTTVLSSESLDLYGWRIAFLVGFAAVPCGLWMRSRLPETLHTPASNLEPTDGGLSRLTAARRYWKTLLLGVALLGGGTIAAYTSDYLVTYAQDTLHTSTRMAFVAQLGNIVAGIPAVLLGGHLSDRIGRWRVNVWGNSLLLLLIVPIFLWFDAARSGLALVVGAAVLGAAVMLPFGSQCAALGESLPQTIRSSAFGTTYALAIAVFGGSTQIVVTWLIHLTGSALAPAWYMLAATVVTQIAVVLLPESAPARLTSPQKVSRNRP